MDPFTALGVAAAVAQFAEFGYKVGERLLSMYDKDVLDSYDYFALTTRDLDGYLTQMSEHIQRRKSTNATAVANDEAIEKLVTQCHAVAKSLVDKFDQITRVYHSHESRFQMAIATVKATIQAIKAVWGQNDIERTLRTLEGFRSQIALRILLALDIKASESMVQSDRLESNLSDVVDIMAVYQERQRSAASDQAQFLEARLNQSDELTRRFHKDTIAAIYTLRNGQTKILGADAHHRQDFTGTHDNMQRKVVQFRSAALSSVAKAEDRDLKAMEDRILHSIYFRQITDRLETVKSRHEETYEWVFCDPVAAEKPWADFALWLISGSGVYWICGKAGAGKSTMMKFLYQDKRTMELLQQWAGSQSLRTAAFFFWGLGSGVQKSQKGLLRALLHEILSRDPQLIPLVMTELLPVVSHLKPEEKLSEPSLAELMKWFRRLLDLSRHQRLFFLVDGLDEYDGDPSEIVEFITSLSQYENVKFLVSSRPIPVCVENLSSFPMLHLHDLTREDIRRYAHDSLKRRWRQTIADIAVFVEQIVEKSFGVFIWVELSVLSLIRGLENRDNAAELRKRLDELPSDLADLYSHMLRDMSPLYRKQAAQLFQITLSATRNQICPLTTLQASFLEEEGGEAVLHSQVPIRQITKSEEMTRCDAMAGRIRSRCCGLVETRRATSSESKMLSCLRFEYPCVDFLHRTVVEFLADPVVWKGILELSGPEFVPEVSLFHASSCMCRVFECPRAVKFDSSLVWNMVPVALGYASLCEASQTPIPAACLRRLDAAMAHQWKRMKSLTTNERTSKVVGHWANFGKNSPFSSVMIRMSDPLDFTSIAVALKLVSFIQAELTSPTSALSESTTLKSKQLFDATRELVEEYEGDRSLLTICEQLLEHGADPNAELGVNGQSAWERILQHAVEDKGDRRQFTRSFNDGGSSRVFAKLVSSFVENDADVNARVVWRSKRYRGDAQPVTDQRSALSVMYYYFKPSTVEGSGSLASFWNETPEPEMESNLLKNFHERLIRSMTDRGAVAREWRNDVLVSGPEQPSVSSAPPKAKPKTWVRFREKVGWLGTKKE